MRTIVLCTRSESLSIATREVESRSDVKQAGRDSDVLLYRTDVRAPAAGASAKARRAWTSRVFVVSRASLTFSWPSRRVRRTTRALSQVRQ